MNKDLLKHTVVLARFQSSIQMKDRIDVQGVDIQSEYDPDVLHPIFIAVKVILKILFGSGHAIGMDITIFSPSKDVDGSIARNLVSSLVAGISYNNNNRIHTDTLN